MKVKINGITCTATPVGGGMYAATPDNIGEALAALLSGKLSQFGTPQIEVLSEDTPAAPTSTQSRQRDETISQYRQRTGVSKTALADQFNVSRRTLGRWEAAGRRMSQV
jgi:DNA-binding transcriptional regulator YiaG